METLKSAAILTIHDAPHMTLRGRLEIARWLIKQAYRLVVDGRDFYAGFFRARYRYVAQD